MTGHELAKKLLELPDVEVIIDKPAMDDWDYVPADFAKVEVFYRVTSKYCTTYYKYPWTGAEQLELVYIF